MNATSLLTSLLCLALLQTGSTVYGGSMNIDFTGYSRTETLSNFPAVVVFSNGVINGFTYDQFSSDSAGDLRFTENGSSLNHEIDYWDTNGTSYVWVQVPALTSNTIIRASWGGDTNPPVYTTNGATWASSDYAAVWHLNDLSPEDSTAGNHDGTLVSTGASQTNESMFGSAIRFAGGSTARFSITDHADFHVQTNNFTFSAWLNFSGGGYDMIMSKGQWNTGSGFAWRFHNTERQQLYLSGSATTGTNTLSFNQWYHLTASRKNGVLNLYLNGHLENSAAMAQTIDSGHNITIGSRASGGLYFVNGYIDELRYQTTDRSTNWAWACFMNQASNSVFSAYTPSSSGLAFTIK